MFLLSGSSHKPRRIVNFLLDRYDTPPTPNPNLDKTDTISPNPNSYKTENTTNQKPNPD